MSDDDTDKLNLSKDPYRGVRDMYPAEMHTQNYLYALMRETAEEYGYEEYDASLLEPKELYEAKTGEEIVEEQMYSFEDRGERDVSLRPEMTPTVARMMAQKYKELAFPVRWYAIPNLFRYERPQRGRLREHWQLNADIFGVDSIDAEVEVIMLTASLFFNAGARQEDFVIHINHRGLVDALLSDELGLDDTDAHETRALIDKYKKMDRKDFEEAAKKVLGDTTPQLLSVLTADSLDALLDEAPSLENTQAKAELESLQETLQTLGLENITYDPTLVRGLDYYTGTVFEVFDTAEENSRSLAGGGRYDELLSLFDEAHVPAVGVGIGDVTFKDFLSAHDLIPNYSPSTDLMICVVSDEFITDAYAIAENLRDAGLHVGVDISGKAVGTQIKNADNASIPFIACIGEDEITNKSIHIKELSSGEEKTFADIEDTDTLEDIAEMILAARDESVVE